MKGGKTVHQMKVRKIVSRRHEKWTLEVFGQKIMESREKKRYEFKDKRLVTMDPLFGSITVKRNYYRDRIKDKYVSLLDQSLAFEGLKGIGPAAEEMAMELATIGPSYRHASKTLEKLLGILSLAMKRCSNQKPWVTIECGYATKA